MRRIILLVVALSFICLPLLAEESDSGDTAADSGEDTELADSDSASSSTGAGASSGGTFSCGKMGAGGVGASTTESDAADETGTGDDGSLADQELYNSMQGEGGDGGGGGDAEFEEMECDPPNDVGVFVCYGIAGPTSAYCCNPDTHEQIPYFVDCVGCPAM